MGTGCDHSLAGRTMEGGCCVTCALKEVSTHNVSGVSVCHEARGQTDERSHTHLMGDRCVRRRTLPSW